ncbi:MAG: hypothetical protein H6730_12665 [Deltaproteobacteria bacterium]|nr:hypothetical protein [Deltaproteobacteria bacterium]
MRTLELLVDEVRIEAGATPEAVAALGPVVQAAFEVLAERLSRGPHGRFSDAGRLELEALSVSTLSVEELVGPRGVERLADALYEALLQGVS